MCKEPILDILVLDTNSKYTLGIADISTYPTGFNISSPTIEITPPGYMMESIIFVPRTIQMFDSGTLGISCGDGCSKTPIPDGVYKIRYSVYPNYKYTVTKSIIRVDELVEKFDKVYIQLGTCDTQYENQLRNQMHAIWAYINEAIAAANNCMEKQAMELYRKASSAIDNLLKNKCHPTWNG